MTLVAVGAMYQPYTSTPAPLPYLPPGPGPYGAPALPASPSHTHYQEHPLPLKRELVDSQYKPEREMVAGEPRLDSRMSGQDGPYSSPREHHGGSSAGSCGTPDPRTPVSPQHPSSPRQGERSEGEEEDLAQGRSAQYISRNVVLYTHYSGEVSSIVDEHFTKALNQTTFSESKGAPMASRNLPPSFFNAHYHAKLPYAHPEASGLYSEAYTQGLHHLAAHASSPDPWQYAAQATATSSYHRSVQDLVAQTAGQAYSSSPASRLQSQYSLFLNSPSSRLHSGQIKSEPGNPWGEAGAAYPGHGPGGGAPEFPGHPLDRNYSPHPAYNMASSGLEPAGQEAPKDLYWPTF